jgi:hypothetical protein
MTFSPDGKYIADGGGVGAHTIKVWETESGREIRTLTGHLNDVTSVAFSPDGKYIASGSQDTTTRLWDASTGKELAQFVSFDDGEWVCLTPEGYYNASTNGDQHLNLRVGTNVYGIDQYRSAFYKPEIVALALSGDSAAYFAAIKSELAFQNVASAPPVTPDSAVTVDKALGDFTGYIGERLPESSLTAVALMEAPVQRLGNYLTDELISRLLDANVRVVSRQDFERLLDEQGRQTSLNFDDEGTARIGHNLGWGTIVYGTIELLQNACRLSLCAVDVESGELRGARNYVLQSDVLLESLVNPNIRVP